MAERTEEKNMRTCQICGGRFTGEEVSEWRADHEAFQDHPLICPDCYDREINHKDLEAQFEVLMRR